MPVKEPAKGDTTARTFMEKPLGALLQIFRGKVRLITLGCYLLITTTSSFIYDIVKINTEHNYIFEKISEKFITHWGTFAFSLIIHK